MYKYYTKLFVVGHANMITQINVWLSEKDTAHERRGQISDFKGVCRLSYVIRHEVITFCYI